MSEPADDLLPAVRQFGDRARTWHSRPPETCCAGNGIAAESMELHALNFALWHHEDAVRRPGVADHEVARRKRSIDDLNARRNAAIEHLDAALLECLNPNQDAPLHTETPGTIVDRLSILALRIAHAGGAQPRRALLEEQYDDLCSGLERLLAGLQGGELRFKLYRQFKAGEQRSYCALFEGSE